MPPAVYKLLRTNCNNVNSVLNMIICEKKPILALLYNGQFSFLPLFAK